MERNKASLQLTQHPLTHAILDLPFLPLFVIFLIANPKQGLS
jgi:hypothetical protein